MVEGGLGQRLVGVAPPTTGVVRVAHRSGDPFEPPDWSRARPDGTFGNRFDDPSKEAGRSEEARFRVIYCATLRTGAFGETIARFRPPLHLLANPTDPSARAIEAARGDLVDPEHPRHGLVPTEWRLRRQLGVTILDPGLRFVDLMAAESIQALRVMLAMEAARLGLPDVDLSAVAGPHRRRTQVCARSIHEEVAAAGQPRFAGIRYLSRLNTAWECWAIFADRMRHRPQLPKTILPDDAALLEAASILDLTIESVEGNYLRPWQT